MKEFVDTFKDYFYFFILQNFLNGNKSVLDVGCGAHSPLGKWRSKFTCAGIDIFKKSIETSKKEKNLDRHILGDINHLEKYFKPKSFDAVMSMDVVEHLTKTQAKSMIKKMELIARKRVVIMTPNGFYPQDMLEGNPHQVHKSGWYVEDFEKMGYKVYGLRGLKWIRGIHATIQYKPWFFWGLIAFITEPLLYFLPAVSYDLFAVKDIL